MSTAWHATYRLQLQPDFDFYAAAALTPYLAQLGISHLYASPYLQAVPGSSHGYDIVNPHQVNAELGGERGHSHLCRQLQQQNLGQILDIVPNHMAITGPENAWWWDVLENGPASLYASYFDVDWHLPSEQDARIQLPVLGDHYGRILERGEIQLGREGSRLAVTYYEHRFPLAPHSLGQLLQPVAMRLEHERLRFLAGALQRLPQPAVGQRAQSRNRHRDKEVLLSLWRELGEAEPQVIEAVDQQLQQLNAQTEELHAILEQQNYRLALWRTARHDLGYRRFFDINDLVALCSEDPEVFADTHKLILHWLDQGLLQGVRIDHPDGLKDPQAYLNRLQEAAPEAYIAVEKILLPGEQLPHAWPVAGTTGYEFLYRVNHLLLDADSCQALTHIYQQFTGRQEDYDTVLSQAKHQVIQELFESDVNRLSALMQSICERHLRYRDFTRTEISAALTELVVHFPVYRTYVRGGAEPPSEEDARLIRWAISQAQEQQPQIDPELFTFLQNLLLCRYSGNLEQELPLRLQQLTGPVMAKGAEDTACYRYYRLTALNEVGGEPGHWALSPEDFHAANQHTQAHWPWAMLTTSTHDTKRSEDLRARLLVLSEIPQLWQDTVTSWAAHNQGYKTALGPDANTEYLIYQTLVGAYPISEQRLAAYLEKALREAKEQTSWHRVNSDYEQACQQFVQQLYQDDWFQNQLQSFVAAVEDAGYGNSLSQLLLKLTCPGLPDIYQGSELWDFSLVDPDNRRPVDFQQRQQLLQQLDSAELTPELIWQQRRSGLPKIWLLRQALALRRQWPAAFGAKSSYQPLYAEGSQARHVVAFCRAGQVLTLVTRLPWRLAREGYQDLRLQLPAGSWYNVLTQQRFDGGQQQVGQLLQPFPVGLFQRQN